MRVKKICNFLDLNDDCLLEILKYLTINETFQIVGLFDSRFDEVAYARIAAYKHLDVNFREMPHFTTAELAVIGKNLKSIKINVGYSIASEQLLRILQPLCESGSTGPLEKLTLNYITFSPAFCDCLSSVAAQLQQVDFSFCQLTDESLTEFLIKCQELRELRVIGNYTLYGEFLKRPNIKFPNYIEIELHDLWTYPIEQFAFSFPHVQLVVYQQGRETHQRYNFN